MNFKVFKLMKFVRTLQFSININVFQAFFLKKNIIKKIGIIMLGILIILE